MTLFFSSVCRCSLAFLIVALLGFGPAHKFFLSTTSLEHNVEQKSLEITVQSFTHDFEAALEAGTEDRLFLGSERENAAADERIQAYLKKHLKFRVNGESKSFTYIGKEVEIHDCYLYLEIKGVEKVKQIEVENTLLVARFPEQVNEIKLNAGGQKQQLTLHAGKLRGTLSVEAH